MSFKEWHDKAYHPDFGHEHLEWEERAWDAALNQALEVANRKLRGITPECSGYNKCSTETVKAIEELKTDELYIHS